VDILLHPFRQLYVCVCHAYVKQVKLCYRAVVLPSAICPEVVLV